MEWKISLRKYTPVRRFVSDYVVKNLDRFGYRSNVKKNFYKFFKAKFF